MPQEIELVWQENLFNAFKFKVLGSVIFDVYFKYFYKDALNW